MLAERGIDAPLEAVAKQAGVAIGTLCRHFPERGDLIDAILDEKTAGWAELARQALSADDAWEGLVRFLERTCGCRRETGPSPGWRACRTGGIRPRSTG
ncbi:TetR/AcrR family transcriptional regulator [Nonomuraea deserti]|uniref:TetR/AcrR family transcriptional regulator n=1 Tax=Nonomuraea deserti TaxID=1848322 RepID=A0A4R4V781_9ACTN|nr:TetR/AcrR family transcriptional regulator [Nonomuraea deserti]